MTDLQSGKAEKSGEIENPISKFDNVNNLNNKYTMEEDFKLHEQSGDVDQSDQPLNLNYSDDSFEKVNKNGIDVLTEEKSSNNTLNEDTVSKECISDPIENNSNEIIEKNNILSEDFIENTKTVDKINPDDGKLTEEKRYKGLIDDDTISGECPTEQIESINNSNDNIQKNDMLSIKKGRMIIDSDDSSSEDDNKESVSVNRSKENGIKMTSKEAEQQRMLIKSETQRLSRETHISIPYHKPKKFTLQEFMTRKTVVNPTQLLHKACNQLKSSKPKMTPEELEQYSKYLESRVKEATEFFKSESEKDEINFTPTTEEPQLECNQPEKIDSADPPLLNIENLRKLSNEGLPKISKLKGDSNMLVDLETGECISPKPSGVENLLSKFLKHSLKKRKPKSTVSVNILSTENGIVEMTNTVINVDDNNDDLARADQKPGTAYMKLKENLKHLIIQKRKNQLTKKIQENQSVNEKEKEIENNSECDDEADEDDNKEQDEDAELNEDEIDYEETMIDQCEADDEFEDEDDNDDDKDEVENFSKRKSKKRIVQPFHDSDDECEDKANDHDTSLVRNNEKDLDDERAHLDSFSIQNQAPVISQIPTTQASQNVDENELMNLCSGKFTNVAKESSLNINEDLDLQMSDEENNVILNKNKKKKYGPIEDDDDVDDNNESRDNILEEESIKDKKEESDDEEQEKDEGEELETYIDYDSEENEIEVKLTKNERLKKAKEFFENEAELSESEWNSDDEDEKDIDKYDIEIGDEDNFDDEQLKNELEKIHMRKTLDQDIRDVRKLQEMFFEDEENDGVGRQRQFKWRNLDDGGFALDGQNNMNEMNDEGESGDEQQEEYWRKMRYERQQLLKEKNIITEEDSTQNLRGNVQEFQLIQKKLTIMKPKNSTTSISDIKSPFLISQTEKVLKRASFLERDKETLIKLASSMKMSNERDDDDDIMCLKTVNTKNFVFQVISEKNPNSKCLKRKICEKEDTEENGRKKKYCPMDGYKRKKTLKN